MRHLLQLWLICLANSSHGKDGVSVVHHYVNDHVAFDSRIFTQFPRQPLVRDEVHFFGGVFWVSNGAFFNFRYSEGIQMTILRLSGKVFSWRNVLDWFTNHVFWCFEISNYSILQWTNCLDVFVRLSMHLTRLLTHVICPVLLSIATIDGESITTLSWYVIAWPYPVNRYLLSWNLITHALKVEKLVFEVTNYSHHCCLLSSQYRYFLYHELPSSLVTQVIPALSQSPHNRKWEECIQTIAAPFKSNPKRFALSMAWFGASTLEVCPVQTLKVAPTSLIQLCLTLYAYRFATAVNRLFALDLELHQ